VRSDPTPPQRPRLDVAPPAPGRLPADGPARFGQQPTVAPVFDRVSLDTQSFADLGKPNRLMLGVLVRHGAPAPCSRSERRCLGSRRQRPLDTRSVGREFVLTYPAGGAVPDPQAEGDARRPAGGEGTNPAGRPARSGPLGALGNQGTVPPARSLGVATRTTSGQTDTDPTDRGLTGMPIPRRSRPVLPRRSRTGPRW